MNSFFTMMQTNDAAFPIGGYTQSYGLETYIQQGLVKDYETALRYLHRVISNSFLYSELLAVRLAYEAADRRDFEEIEELEVILHAAKAPKELREASNKLGSRFVKMAALVFPEEGLFHEYQQRTVKATTAHAVAYGVFSAAAGIAQEQCLGAYLYAQLSAVVTNCVKAVPLSQTDGQRILAASHGLFETVLEKLKTLDKGDLCRSCPGQDIRSMQHEVLYSRLYMS